VQVAHDAKNVFGWKILFIDAESNNDQIVQGQRAWKGFA
jgi:hypothetical protein